ncbi:VQ motif-containing protein 22-like [Corylus avellana]|uniref:VQ motif-containing protein 22-like n=1 Tax=Corylus avellana TaxID=13451 RepID=UPI001E211ADF|nr:VQ motif-containing protein 22-like [Corylus avellana]
MNNTTIPPTSDHHHQWLPFYDHQSAAIDGQPPPLSHDTTIDSSPSAPNNAHQLTPKGSVSKAARRRSRASKRTPTTLLNANANNFRALVQQFTGCPSAAISFGNQKGPVNLDFGRGREENQRIISSLMAPFTNNNNYDDHHHFLQQSQSQQYHHQQQQHHHQSMYSSGNIMNINASSNVEIADGFALDDNVSFHHLTMDSFSGDLKSSSDGFF